MFENAPAAQRKEFRDLELHDAVIVAFAQTKVLDGCDLGSIDRQQFDFILAARITILLGPDRLGDPALAVLVPRALPSSPN